MHSYSYLYLVLKTKPIMMGIKCCWTAKTAHETINMRTMLSTSNKQQAIVLSTCLSWVLSHIRWQAIRVAEKVLGYSIYLSHSVVYPHCRPLSWVLVCFGYCRHIHWQAICVAEKVLGYSIYFLELYILTLAMIMSSWCHANWNQ